MNLTSDSGDSSLSSVQFVSFNQDSSSLAIGTKSGYKLFSLPAMDRLEKTHDDESGDYCIVERLFSSSLVALVSLSSPRKMRVCHYKKGSEICCYSYTNSILAVKMNRQRLVVVLENAIFVYNIRDMKQIHSILNTARNAQGLCALSANNDNCFLAYPASETNGEVQIFDSLNLSNKIMIPAHDNPIAALAFDLNGTKIATASDRGTIIRVHNVTDGATMHEFRRGYARCVSIYSLSFSTCGNFLCASSDTETVHVFKFEDPSQSPKQEDDQATWSSWIQGKIVGIGSTFLPTQVSDAMNQWRSFATAKLPFSGLKNVCSICNIGRGSASQPFVLVASANGILYVYSLDEKDGGECNLVKQHRFDEAISVDPHRAGPPGTP